MRAYLEEAALSVGKAQGVVTLEIVVQGVRVRQLRYGRKTAEHVVVWAELEHARINPLLAVIERMTRETK